jgi:hypothetical protein
MSQDVSTFFSSHIEPLRGLENRALDRALSQTLKAFSAHIWGWTRTACRAHGDRQFQHADDVFNVISWELSKELRKELLSAARPPIGNFYAYFQKISQRESFKYFHSGERTGFSNATGATRRLSKINKTRKEMSIALGFEPSDQQVVDEVNRVAILTRKDAKKQGALVTLDDLKVTTFSSLDGLAEEFGDSIWSSDDEDDVPLSRVEAPSLVTYIIEGCETVSLTLGKVAQAWIGDALSEPPVVRTDREIATMLALKLGTVTQLLDDCKAVAVAVCAEKFGLESPFV